MTMERYDLHAWSVRNPHLVKFQAVRLPDGVHYRPDPRAAGWLHPAANDGAADDRRTSTAQGVAAGTSEAAAAQRAAAAAERMEGGESAFDHLYYAIGPNLQPNLPPDIAARFTYRLIEGGERLLRALFIRPAGWPLRWAEALMRGHDRRKERRVYDQMTDHMLKDIGLSRCDLYDDLAERQRSRHPR